MKLTGHPYHGSGFLAMQKRSLSMMLSDRPSRARTVNYYRELIINVLEAGVPEQLISSQNS